jgi:hypothetical protein
LSTSWSGWFLVANAQAGENEQRMRLFGSASVRIWGSGGRSERIHDGRFVCPGRFKALQYDERDFLSSTE